jgi:hypothetical protein
MTIIDLINAISSGIDNGLLLIGNIKLAYLAFWSFAGPLLGWAWYRAFESVYLFAWLPYKARKRHDASFNGTTIDG